MIEAIEVEWILCMMKSAWWFQPLWKIINVPRYGENIIIPKIWKVIKCMFQTTNHKSS